MARERVTPPPKASSKTKFKALIEGISYLDADVCDVNYDGKIDSRDATKILVYYAKSMVDKVPSSLRDFVSTE